MMIGTPAIFAASLAHTPGFVSNVWTMVGRSCLKIRTSRITAYASRSGFTPARHRIAAIREPGLREHLAEALARSHREDVEVGRELPHQIQARIDIRPTDEADTRARALRRHVPPSRKQSLQADSRPSLLQEE